MYFKVNRKQLKNALLLLQNRIKAFEKDPMNNGENNYTYLTLTDYVEEIQFALYKTKLNEFYIDYEFAQQIRSSLNKKDREILKWN